MKNIFRDSHILQVGAQALRQVKLQINMRNVRN